MHKVDIKVPRKKNLGYKNISHSLKCETWEIMGNRKVTVK